MKNKSRRSPIVALLVLFSTQQALSQSPYEVQGKREAALLSAGGVTLIGGLALNAGMTPLTPDEIAGLSKDDINFFDRGTVNNYSTKSAQFSDVLLLGCLVLPGALVFSQESRQDFDKIGLMYAETLLLVNGLAQIAKGAFQRIRPFAYNPDAPYEPKLTAEARKSFYSGHATNAFSGAVFFATVFNEYHSSSSLKPVVWGGSLLAAGATAYLRVAAGKHFPTDVLAGAAIGGILGYWIPRLHRAHEAENPGVTPFEHSKRIAFALRFNIN